LILVATQDSISQQWTPIIVKQNVQRIITVTITNHNDIQLFRTIKP